MIFDVFSDCVERVFKLQKQCHILLNVWRTIDPLLRSDGIILKSRKCGRESEKILEKISLIWLISLNFSQPGKILKQFLCFVKLPGEISRTGGWGARGDLSRERSQELSLSLCCSFVVIIGNMEWILFSWDTATTHQSHQVQGKSF